MFAITSKCFCLEERPSDHGRLRKQWRALPQQQGRLTGDAGQHSDHHQGPAKGPKSLDFPRFPSIFPCFGRREVRGTAVMGSVSAMVNRRAAPARLLTLEEAELEMQRPAAPSTTQEDHSVERDT